MNIKLYFNKFKNNYIENIVYPYNYALLSTGLIRNNLNMIQTQKLNDYSKNYWLYSISKERKKYWIEYFVRNKLYQKIDI